MNRWLAWIVAMRAVAKKDWGDAHPENAAPRHVPVLGWSSDKAAGLSLQSVHEDFQTGFAVVVAQAMPAYYLHVDDAVFWSTKAEDGLCTQLVETAASSLRNIGFTVTDVQHSSEAKKAIGFALEQEPSKLVLTRERMAALYGSLCRLVEIDMVDTVILRSVLAIWIWAATLRRE